MKELALSIVIIIITVIAMYEFKVKPLERQITELEQELVELKKLAAKYSPQETGSWLRDSQRKAALENQQGQQNSLITESLDDSPEL